MVKRFGRLPTVISVRAPPCRRAHHRSAIRRKRDVYLRPCAKFRTLSHGATHPHLHFFRFPFVPKDWRTGWHAFRRGLATNLHALGVEDKTIQAILRHSTLVLTMNVYVKTVGESQTNALDSLSAQPCNASATQRIQ
jgi:integrase